jgi:UDP:flavonoid glycosyltransferase YjiC (YdhE family)
VRALVLASTKLGGDHPPLLAVARGLKERGHAVTLLGDPDLDAVAGEIGLRTLASDERFDISGVYRDARTAAEGLSPSELGERIAGRLAEWSTNLVPALTEVLTAEPYDLVVVSVFFATAAAAACRARGLRWAVVRSSFYQGPGSTRPLESDYGPLALPAIRRMRQPALAQANLVLHPTVIEFEPPLSGIPAHHHLVGPLLWEPATPAPSYLAEPGDPWVVVNLSTVAQADLAIVDAALRRYPLRVLVTLGASRNPEDLADIPPNARVERYVPHTHVLKRASLVISRAGFGTFMKALYYAVPMVLVPWGSDQAGVAFRARRLGAAQAVDFEDLDRATMAQAIETVLGSVSYAMAAREASAVLRARDGVGAASSLLEGLVRDRA